MAPTASNVLAPQLWQSRARAYRELIAPVVDPHSDRARRGIPHPVLDFLFTYYNLRPGRLRRWHPGFGVTLAEAPRYLDYTGYVAVDGGVTVTSELLNRKRPTIEYIAELIGATARRTPLFGCFGLHEWAMVYRDDDTRHDLALRLGRAGTDAVTESLPLRCSHFDAFRFFTEPARPRNITQLTRERQADFEQPGCIHATMDLYKWSAKLGPLVCSDLVGEALLLAVAAREIDMRASPYDLAEYGYEPIAIETAEGRAQYAREQAALTARAEPLRARLSATCAELLA